MSIAYKSLIEEEPDVKGYREALEKYSGRELDLGISLIGPHRDDICILSKDGLFRQYASRGQMRIASMMLKMAEVWMMTARSGRMPVLLIDDVLFELDQRHRNLFLGRLEMFKEMQIIRCATEKSFVPDISECVVHEI